MRRRIRLGGYPPPLVVYGGLALGVSAVSSAAVIIRLADAPSLTIAAYRLALASDGRRARSAWCSSGARFGR